MDTRPTADAIVPAGTARVCRDQQRPQPGPRSPRQLDRVSRTAEQAVRRRLTELQRSTGLPVVFGGVVPDTAPEVHFDISAWIGTISEALSGLVIRRGLGLGGTALQRGIPCRVDDYISAHAITHTYDAMVAAERLTSIFAVPVEVDGRVRSVLYGALRSGAPIGDRTIRQASAVAAQLQAELRDIRRSSAVPPEPDHRPAEHEHPALAELDDIIATTTDAHLRQRLRRVHREFSRSRHTGPVHPGLLKSSEPPEPTTVAGAAKLTPREIDVLAMVATGGTNADIAEGLGLSVQTIKAYLKSAMGKLEVRNRTAAVHVCREIGLL